MSWKASFEEGLETYKTPLTLLTAATLTILVARLVADGAVALSLALGFFVLGALSLLAAGVTAAYTIVRAA
jgi:hypothetical protein